MRYECGSKDEDENKDTRVHRLGSGESEKRPCIAFHRKEKNRVKNTFEPSIASKQTTVCPSVYENERYWPLRAWAVNPEAMKGGFPWRENRRGCNSCCLPLSHLLLERNSDLTLIWTRRGCSSHGRALALHARGTGFDTPHLHLHFIILLLSSAFSFTVLSLLSGIFASSLHQWSSGRIVPCHGTDPGSIPGWCNNFQFCAQ